MLAPNKTLKGKYPVISTSRCGLISFKTIAKTALNTNMTNAIQSILYRDLISHMCQSRCHSMYMKTADIVQTLYVPTPETAGVWALEYRLNPGKIRDSAMGSMVSILSFNSRAFDAVVSLVGAATPARHPTIQ